MHHLSPQSVHSLQRSDLSWKASSPSTRTFTRTMNDSLLSHHRRKSPGKRDKIKFQACISALPTRRSKREVCTLLYEKGRVQTTRLCLICRGKLSSFAAQGHPKLGDRQSSLNVMCFKIEDRFCFSGKTFIMPDGFAATGKSTGL